MLSYYHDEMLFSEIYLEEITQEVETADLLAALKVITEYRDFADKSTLKGWKDSYVHEVLSALGFYAKPKSESLTELFPMGSGDGKPCSLCYIVLPDESLDNTIIGRNWAEKIIRALRESDLQWGILTNGKQWRIYHQDEPTPYETYLEIDLEAIMKDKAKDAYQLFHKFMKAENFTLNDEGKCQFDRFKKDSQDKIDYIEKELAKALKQREEGGKGVLSDLCMGYVEALRSRGETNLDDEEQCKTIYHSAMLYMFRLLFLFYADARGLLSDDNHVLFERIETECRARFESAKSGNEDFPVWGSLEQIFVDIDQTYNGGLFSPQESKFTEFISDTRIGDNYLVNVIYNLSTYQEKNKQVKLISYRDMSVRHLGTLYEGLLEHKLFIAREDTEVKLSKGKIQFIPASQGGKLKVGSHIRAGEVYFAGDASERKATGSYYTPEYIVDYIVQKTVGEKLKEFKETFLKEQQPTIKAIATAMDQEERQTLSRLFEEKLVVFVRDKVLNLSVLDPAMGSGHFLVNAANLISNFITEVLNEISIHGDQESGTGYWRRWVVENCIYGVDLNPLAVELAKLSLWILSMAKNQPLSFLKHHLKCGNSLVGTKLESVGSYPFSTSKKQARQLSLFEQDPDFRSAVEEAILKSQLIASHGSTARNEVEDKKAWLDQMDQVLLGYKAICNIHTGLFFNSDEIDENQYTLMVENKDFDLAYSLETENQYFHWELEFPLVLIKQKGFDCVIGNPPYVDVLGDQYTDRIYTTYKGRNLYNYFVERGLRLLNQSEGNLGFIIPISIITSERMKSTREFIRAYRGTTKFINIDSSANPGTLFDGLKLRLSITFIHLRQFERKMRVFSSDFTKFFNAEREIFIPLIETTEIPEDVVLDTIIPKIGSPIEVAILKKMLIEKYRIIDFLSKSDQKNSVYYKANGYNYMLAFSKLPFFEVNGLISQNSMTEELFLPPDIPVSSLICLFPTSLFYWFWTIYSDCFHFSQRDLSRFPINLQRFSKMNNVLLRSLSSELENDLENKAELVTYNKANGPTRYFQYRARYTKPLFDRIDDLLGEYYGFTEEELDFVKNYDLRFRTDDR